MLGSKLITVADHVQWAQTLFDKSELHFGHGCTNSYDEAVWATLHVIGLIKEDYQAIRLHRLSDADSRRLQQLVQDRISLQKPLAYLISEAWFAGYSFYIDERAIVPRSHIGDFIRDGLHSWIEVDGDFKVLDMCTGSGCIAVALALNYPTAKVDAVDIDEQALQVARINIDRHHCQKQVTAIQSDLFQNLADRTYDLILCNPPYVSASEIEQLPGEYHYEPRLALEADDNGLGIVKQILSNSVHHLSPDGFLMMELGNSTTELEAAYPNYPFLWLTSEGGESVVLLITAEELKKADF